MTDIFEEGWGKDLGRSQLAQLLLLNEAALDRKIARDLAELPEDQQGRILHDSGPEEPGTEAQRRGALERWRDFKRGVLSLPGSFAARLVRRYAPGGGEDFCRRIDYCRRKAWIGERLDALSHIEGEKAWAADQALDYLREHLPDLMDFASETFDLLSEICGDYLVPGSFLVKVIKYGLDETCPCCLPCSGSGRSGSADCSSCRGTGLRTPFPQ
ncbi:hypothetical protein AAFN88_14865 [Pelagibius sp. CAU 1746]|uniref:hypothetical protein n=1 Tax=Pelagibius sp. CAU 1746 TaxID=3140370 RepID=UPI00325B8666